LTRNATTQASGTYTQVDNLTYTYSGTNANQLISVTDGTGANYTGTGFRNLTGSTGSYGYDSNGNLNSDPYKGLSFSAYNVLNRVDKITCTAYTGRYVDYTYDGSGNLIRKRQYDNNALVHTTDYIDGFVYLDNTISYYCMPEGRVMNIGGTMKPEYIITDHQGNARVSFMDNGSGTAVVEQENSYYGFGMVMPGSLITGDNNKRLYNDGSEWQNDFSNLPDYYQTYYRNYDAALGRWIGTDPIAGATESISVYQYSNNNPIMFNDPLGDLSDAQWLMAVVSYNNGPILSSYHADSGSSDVVSLNDANAFQAGASYAANFDMFGSANSPGGMAGSYGAAVAKYNLSLQPGQSPIITTSPVHVITGTTWFSEPTSNGISGSTIAIELDHFNDIIGKPMSYALAFNQTIKSTTEYEPMETLIGTFKASTSSSFKNKCPERILNINATTTINQNREIKTSFNANINLFVYKYKVTDKIGMEQEFGTDSWNISTGLSWEDGLSLSGTVNGHSAEVSYRPNMVGLATVAGLIFAPEITIPALSTQ